jgi:hypothetical protein
VLIPVLILFLSGLGSVPMLSSAMYSEIEEYEKRTIALDNAAIRLGRRDRNLFRMVDSAATKIRALETTHHALHACARVPSPSYFKCRAADLAIERTIAGLIDALRASVTAAWRFNSARTREELWRGDWRRPEITRETIAPVRFERCPVCGLAARVILEPKRMPTRIEGKHYGDSRIGVRFIRETNWNYRLFYWSKP